MAVTLLASACPPPVVPSGLVWPEDCYAGTDSPDVAGALASGRDPFTPEWNQNAAMLDLATRSGSGGYGLVYGGVISDGGGLNASVTGAVALIDGVVAKKTFALLSLPASQPRVWIWFKQDKTLQYTLTTTKPTAKCVLLGSLATDGSGVIAGSIDTSGVVYFASGVFFRETADLGQPSDSPDSTVRVMTKTSGGLFFWDGGQWALVPKGLSWSKDVIPSGETVVIPSGAQQSIFGTLSVSGRVTVYGKLRVTS
ncbi:MAG: hypothetical protein K1X67_08120 [Fimbriimonadaceae bacterium]|nr:hypothetical protein [Fimbriimonadaceae bacterium]